MGSLVKRKVQWAPILLEVVPGFLNVFGLGHMYQGRFGIGAFIMVSYWAIQVFNLFFLSWFFGLGFVTYWLTWLFYTIAAPMNANDHEG